MVGKAGIAGVSAFKSLRMRLWCPVALGLTVPVAVLLFSCVYSSPTGTHCCPRGSCRSQAFGLRTVASSIAWPQTLPASVSAMGPGSLCQVRVLFPA